MGKESTADAKTDAIPRRKFLADSLAGAVSLSVAGCAQSRSTLNNKEPGDRAGRIAMTLAEKREDLRRKYIESIGPIPEPVPLDLCVESKREIYGNYFSDYEEWRIEYSVESPDTMAEPAGRTIPAYLLIPKGARHQPPFPAMICYHQCGLDCAVGKDAVVGRFPERQHQQYGYELVQKGFVVLAPDAICCGERQVPWVQKEGAYGPGVRRECWFKGQHGKNSPIMDHFGRSWQNKVVTDGLRSVDLLQSLEFVDSERIGAIGHSLGARQTGTHMAYDTRVRAGIHRARELLDKAGERAGWSPETLEERKQCLKGATKYDSFSSIDAVDLPAAGILGIVFATSPCTTGGGEPGAQSSATPLSVGVTNFPGACTDTLAGAMVIEPTASVCTALLMSVSPTDLNFGSSEGDLTFTISNDGPGPFQWSGILSDLDGVFSFTPAAGSLQPTEATLVTVTFSFAGGAAAHLGSISFTTNPVGVPGSATIVNLTATTP